VAVVRTRLPLLLQQQLVHWRTQRQKLHLQNFIDPLQTWVVEWAQLLLLLLRWKQPLNQVRLQFFQNTQHHHPLSLPILPARSHQ
jgi:hypothetical protein